jgi:putative NADH-flavin reductase
MNLIIFGATGRTGTQLVQQALDAHHAVTAFVRNPAKFTLRHPNLHIAQGDVLSEIAVSTAIEGHDVVLSALSADQPEHRAQGMANILNGMKVHGVKRIIAIAGVGILQANDHLKIFETQQFPEQFKPVSLAHWEVCKLLVFSGLDWTFVCPPMIPDGPKTGKYTVKANYAPGGSGTITTGDLAHFMVHELSDNAFVQARVGISN